MTNAHYNFLQLNVTFWNCVWDCWSNKTSKTSKGKQHILTAEQPEAGNIAFLAWKTTKTIKQHYMSCSLIFCRWTNQCTRFGFTVMLAWTSPPYIQRRCEADRLSVCAFYLFAERNSTHPHQTSLPTNGQQKALQCLQLTHWTTMSPPPTLPCSTAKGRMLRPCFHSQID